METSLDVLSRAASYVHANEEEGKWDSSCSGCAGVRQTITQLFVSSHGDKTQGVGYSGMVTRGRLCVKYNAAGIGYASGKQVEKA